MDKIPNITDSNAHNFDPYLLFCSCFSLKVCSLLGQKIYREDSENMNRALLNFVSQNLLLVHSYKSNINQSVLGKLAIKIRRQVNEFVIFGPCTKFTELKIDMESSLRIWNTLDSDDSRYDVARQLMLLPKFEDLSQLRFRHPDIDE